MSSYIDDFFDEERSLPEQGAPKPIAGKAKRNIQVWIFVAIICIALPVAIWQANSSDKSNQDDWKVKEKERTATAARSNKAETVNVDEISTLAKTQEMAAQDIAIQKQQANDPNRPMPGSPTGKPEELPIPPLKHSEVGQANAASGGYPVDTKTEFNTAITTGPILLLSGGNKQIKDAAQQIAGSYAGTAGLSPDMFMSKTPAPDATAATAGIISALQNAQPKPSVTTSGAAEQWMKDKQQPAQAQSSGLSRTPAYQGTAIMEGSMLDAVFLTAINTDLPGEVTALITRDVFDSVNPNKYILIPRGSKVIGEYNSSINVGQERIMMAFKRIIFPDASSIDLQGMPGADAMGRAGLVGDVNNHFFKMFGSSFLIAGLTRLITPKNATVNVNGNGQTGSFTSDAGKILVDIATNVNRRNTTIGPTITIPEGSHFNIRVNKDMHLPPYKMR